MRVLTLLFASIFSLFAQIAMAHDDHNHVGDLVIENPWTRQTPPNAKVGGAYVTITNTGVEADRLVGGSADFANIIEIHNMTMENNVMRMFPLTDGLEIPAGETVSLAPGGLHIMMIDITTAFKKGDEVTITLNFEKAGSIDVTFPVARIGAKEAGHSHH